MSSGGQTPPALDAISPYAHWTVLWRVPTAV